MTSWRTNSSTKRTPTFKCRETIWRIAVGVHFFASYIICKHWAFGAILASKMLLPDSSGLQLESAHRSISCCVPGFTNGLLWEIVW
jgi:hypothetical protein